MKFYQFWLYKTKRKQPELFYINSEIHNFGRECLQHNLTILETLELLAKV